jgi:predicted small metal-binding protein
MERALLCGSLCDCNHSIRGADDDELFGEVLAHLRRDHPAMLFPEERIRQVVAIKAYNVEEYALVYADGEGPDEEEEEEEEFGPEPY